MKKSFLSVLLCFLIAYPCFAKNYQLNGGQNSVINYEMAQKVEPALGTTKLILSYVVPETFNSPTYSQKVSNFNFNFNPKPSKKINKTDKRGNKIVEAIWESPPKAVTAAITLSATNNVNLQKLETTAQFPLKNIPKNIKAYLKGTKQVDINNPKIRKLARDLTKNSKTQFDAVQKILSWIVDHMHYVATPVDYTATYALNMGKGNCQNYSHLAAALMRVVGIPVRIVNGISLKKPYDIRLDKSILTMKMAQGRHSWIEVYFPDLKWVPFDPQDTELFVSNRFIRVEVGLDNNETMHDGLVRWFRAANSPKSQPVFEEIIDADFVHDNVTFTAKKMNYGPNNMLLLPRVEAKFAKVILPPPPPPPKEIPKKKLEELKYNIPFVYGNLDFPENVDFISARGPATKDKDGSMELRKNFLNETAEYVTTRGQQYAQSFILKKPVKLKDIGLALHKFSNSGQIWLELLSDKKGKPNKFIANSDLVELNSLKYKPGYYWVDFKFIDTEVILSPGRYWIALGFSGSPIVNWFFTYGKPTGPQDGTRYKTIFDEDWSRSLSFEFNYRIQGLTTKG